MPQGGGKEGNTPLATNSHGLTPGPSCPSCPLRPGTPSAPCKGNVSISQVPPMAAFRGSAAGTAPLKAARHPWKGAASRGSSRAQVSSPPEAKASWVRSSYGVSFGTRGPLHPSWTLQKSTPGRGSAAPFPLSMHERGPAPQKGRAEPGQGLQYHLPGCPPVQGDRDAPAGPVVPEMQGGDRKLQLGLNPCVAGAKPAVPSHDLLREAQKGFPPPSQPLCRFWGGLRSQPC